MARFFGLDKVKKLWDIVRFNGGIRKSMRKLLTMDDLKIGRLVGEDAHGNKYYENKEYFYGRNRWVEYADHQFLEYDGSQVPPEWHRWLHYMTDDPPNQVPPVKHKWMLPHEENKSGTREAYQPYSTARPYIEPWDPTKKNKPTKPSK